MTQHGRGYMLSDRLDREFYKLLDLALKLFIQDVNRIKKTYVTKDSPVIQARELAKNLRKYIKEYHS